MKASEEGMDLAIDLSGDRHLSEAEIEEEQRERLWQAHPEHPWNRSTASKYGAVTVVSLTALVSTLSSSMPIPGLTRMGSDFGVTNGQVLTLSISLYILAVGVGPFIFSPLSEVYGRRPIYLVTVSLFLIMNLLCGFVSNYPGMLVLRFLAGAFGSAGPGGIGVSSVADLFPKEGRGKPLGLYSISPMAGPPLGALLGAYLDAKLEWRWVYHVLAML